MRTLLFAAIVLPFISRGQINRSATELARENIRCYVTGKIFKDASYQPVSYGELKAERVRNGDVRWTIVHKFMITETEVEAEKKTSIQKPQDFIFYLDSRMKVVKARSYFDSE